MVGMAYGGLNVPGEESGFPEGMAAMSSLHNTFLKSRENSTHLIHTR